MNFKIHTTGRWSPGQIGIKWTASTRRIEPAVEDQIARAWNEAKARLGDKLFDGPLCRMEAWSASPTSLDLTLSHTSYRPFLGTNLTNGAVLPLEVMANPVGMSSALETVDGWLLLGRRSDSVAYHPTRVHPFAGSLEPSEHLDIFEETRRELREELDMSPSDIAEMHCIGMVEDLSLRQPELIFHVRSSLSREQIERNLDPEEHVATYAISTTEVRGRESFDDPILTPIAAASLMLWKQ